MRMVALLVITMLLELIFGVVEMVVGRDVDIGVGASCTGVGVDDGISAQHENNSEFRVKGARRICPNKSDSLVDGPTPLPTKVYDLYTVISVLPWPRDWAGTLHCASNFARDGQQSACCL